MKEQPQYLLAGFLMPHPPLLIESIGADRLDEVAKTTAACNSVAESIANLAPDVIVYVTPHSIVYTDYFHISPGLGARGSFAAFGAPAKNAVAHYDEAFVDSLISLLEERNIYGGTLGEKDNSLDHGVMVPMHFINRKVANYKAVRISQSGMNSYEHYRLGQAIAHTANTLEVKTVILASGDLSHKLTEDGPYGFAKEGPEFDQKIVDILKSGNFLELFTLDPEMCEKSAECGLRSLVVMAGALDGLSVRCEFLSYEGPFGVGYAVSGFYAEDSDEQRFFLEQVEDAEDIYVKLARITLEGVVRTGEVPKITMDLPEEMLETQAGVFVSIKKGRELRGCIGTIAPTRNNIALEIMQNAISAGFSDTRFKEINAAELPLLSYSVDILHPPEAIDDINMLDVEEYGCIVSSGERRGLLLPNLDGISTVEEQVEIAKSKAGILPGEEVKLERFRVIRHT